MLQEVLSRHEKKKNRPFFIEDQPSFIKEKLDHPYSFFSDHAHYQHLSLGNMVLSKFPLESHQVIDLPSHKREQRCVLSCHAKLPSGLTLGLLCTHLNLLHTHRLKQYKTINDFCKAQKETSLILAGDFNDWSQIASKNLTELKEASSLLYGQYLKSFPAPFPRLALDRMYYKGLRPYIVEVLKSSPWTYLSDHLPILARFHYAH